MTQSGQGEEPSARQAHEGIVLPSDGGEPLLPGLADAPVGPPAGGPPPSAPPGGQAWDRPWGPEQQQTPSTGQGWPTPPGAQPWGDPQTPAPPAPQAWPPAPGDPGRPPAAPLPQAGPGPLPPEGAPPTSYGTPAGDPSYGAQPPYGQHQQYPHQQHQEQHQHQQQYGGAGAALPSMPLPSADEGATQYLPPVGASADEGATQYIPHIPPAGPGALPPERPVQPHAGDSTRYLGQAPQYPAQPAASAPAPSPDAEATQFIAPVPGGPAGAPFGAGPGADEGRQPPAEFDNLFRGAPGADGGASATQQMPRFDAPRAQHPAGPGGQSGYVPQGPGGGGGTGRRRGDGDGGRGGRTGSRLPLIAAVGVGIAVVGVGAGAMMAGGGKDEDKGGNQPVSATAPASESASAPASPSADPAEQQAVELDKLLAESGTGRTTVINAVGDVKTCDNLSQAAKDLREAAKQRTGLVDSLGKLSVDKLPQHTELTTALTKAWQASASADNHYAAWADRTAGKKGCKKGKAATQPSAANRASGTASKEKAKAAKLWNAIAQKYGLTERQPTQL